MVAARRERRIQGSILATAALALLLDAAAGAAVIGSQRKAQFPGLEFLSAPKRDSKENPPSWRSDGEAVFYKDSSSEPAARVSIEVPATFSKFMEGLMYRQEISDSQGMLFQWANDGPRSFWMENTYVDLDIIYIDATGTIASIRQATRLDLSSVPSQKPAKDALEVAQGWCDKHGIQVGDKVKYTLESSAFYVAQDGRDFGATQAEVQQAIADGNYDAFR
eukprot:TRINITY_DN40814_c0_g1_i1.p1 TRINITY_DN40814_c0_g1~~TRINITY_DN40814_c0_g1_i1.p1  ORF type:complete len:221 (+),score=53.32 TRINITY_DN40814_c0_g1_i1:76-738(+)